MRRFKKTRPRHLVALVSALAVMAVAAPAFAVTADSGARAIKTPANYNGHEIDLLYKIPAGYNLFEIKSSQTISSRYLKAMGFFEEISGESISSKTLIYAGRENQDRSAFRVRNWLDIPD